MSRLLPVFAVLWLLLSGAASGKSLHTPEVPLGNFLLKLSEASGPDALKNPAGIRENKLFDYEGALEDALCHNDPINRVDVLGAAAVAIGSGEVKTSLGDFQGPSIYAMDVGEASGVGFQVSSPSSPSALNLIEKMLEEVRIFMAPDWTPTAKGTYMDALPPRFCHPDTYEFVNDFCGRWRGALMYSKVPDCEVDAVMQVISMTSQSLRADHDLWRLHGGKTMDEIIASNDVDALVHAGVFFASLITPIPQDDMFSLGALGNLGYRARSGSRFASLQRNSMGGGSLWQSRFPGVQVRQIGNHWVKRVNPNSNHFFQAWGQSTINQQAGALARLRVAGRQAANSRLTSSGRLIVEDVGTPLSRWNYLRPAYWSARRADARALGGAGRLFNDLRPGNYGAGFRSFDPALDPGVGALGIGGGIAIGWGVLWWTLSGEE